MQELILSGVYIHQALETRMNKRDLHHRDDRKIILHLPRINILVVVMKILLFVAEYKLHYIEVSLKTMFNSIKLKLEFTVLKRMRKLAYTPDPALTCQMSKYARQESNANPVGPSCFRSRHESDSDSVHTMCEITIPAPASRRISIGANREAEYRTQKDDTRIQQSRYSAAPSATSHHLTSSLSSLELNLSNFTSNLSSRS
jgi:hypothetical protein